MEKEVDWGLRKALQNSTSRMHDVQLVGGSRWTATGSGNVVCRHAISSMCWRQKLRSTNFLQNLIVAGCKTASVYVGRLVTIRGTVVRASNIKPLVTDLDFLCSKCGEMATERLVDGIYQPPTSCRGDGCRSRTFLPQRKSAKTIDWQKLRIQVSSHSHHFPSSLAVGDTHATLTLLLPMGPCILRAEQ
jgi:hypothetical protein